ncbi:MAG: pitrilysin family protein [Chitinophagaceae bacterium]|nr:pitrilysin family protein [Chitinophagaceae bacterium]
MTHYEKFSLTNGLEVLIIPDETSHLTVVNILYKVGSRNESETKTGFAHLFEHLMFGGSKNIKNFDTELQKVGGKNNAFTSTDITNYYTIVPAANIETAFWLESDRMLELDFNDEVLEVQKKVVIEEFKQRYINQPYGDVWLKLRELAYKVHPYKWATIGKKIEHIEEASIQDVKEFFFNYYSPNNAILTIAGNVNPLQIEKLLQKWFEPIPSRTVPSQNIPIEPIQMQEQRDETHSPVPANAFYKVYKMCNRTHHQYNTTDILSDILGTENTSTFHNTLVKKQQIFNTLNCYITGSIDPGLLVIEGKLNQNKTFHEADSSVNDMIEQIKNNTIITEKDLQKSINKYETSHLFAEIDILHRAMNLAFCSFIDTPELVNTELEKVKNITKEDIIQVSQSILNKENSSTLYYKIAK